MSETEKKLGWSYVDGIRPYMRDDGVLTRIDTQWHTAPEQVITAAMYAVEQWPGGSPKLTEAITLLAKARDCVADHVEGNHEEPPVNSTKKPDGGTALRDHPGMYLRDYFAGQALVGLLAARVSLNVETAYGIADDMLEERKK